MGGNGSWYLAYHHPDRFAAVVVVCGRVSEREDVQIEVVVLLLPATRDRSSQARGRPSRTYLRSLRQ